MHAPLESGHGHLAARAADSPPTAAEASVLAALRISEMLRCVALCCCWMMAQQQAGALVPLPAKMSSAPAAAGAAPLPLSGDFKFHISQESMQGHGTLEAAVSRIEALIFAHGGQTPAAGVGAAAGGLSSLAVTITQQRRHAPGCAPQLGDDESYTLSIPASGVATLTAPMLNGALHGLQTFSQLCRYDYDADAVVIDGAPIAIEDAPRFPHRGLMLDTARHFFPPAAILPLLDAMATVKLNVFHCAPAPLASAAASCGC